MKKKSKVVYPNFEIIETRYVDPIKRFTCKIQFEKHKDTHIEFFAATKKKLINELKRVIRNQKKGLCCSIKQSKEIINAHNNNISYCDNEMKLLAQIEKNLNFM